MNLWYAFDGLVEAELIGVCPERSLDTICACGIELFQISRATEFCCSFRVKRRQVNQLRQICNRQGDIVKFRNRYGFYWVLHSMWKRKALLTGITILLFLTVWLPTRVLFVSVDGNIRIPTKRILESAEDCGIYFGASRSTVRSEKMKNALLAAIPELQWAGINTVGCTAKISVRERTEVRQEVNNPFPTGIVAARDGYILSCTATGGTLLVAPGDTVQAEQLLISPYTDCGLNIRVEQAEGEVFAQTSRQMDVVMPSFWIQKGDAISVKRKISIRIRKKRIFLWKDSGIWDGSCDRMYKEYYITLPGGFRLPVALCIETYTCHERIVSDISQPDAEASLSDIARRLLLQQMPGGRILAADQQIGYTNGVYRMKGRYICAELIGKVRQEQIGDTNGKNN